MSLSISTYLTFYEDLLGHIITGYGLNLYTKANKVVTVPEALSEIRDSKARDLLLKLPYEIEERIPSLASINYGTL